MTALVIGDVKTTIEVSTKFSLEQLREECEAAGLHVDQEFRNDDFALTLARVG